MHVSAMIGSHPGVGGEPSRPLVDMIEAVFDCAQACNACADACLSEADVVNLRQCIRLDLDCAAVCLATGEIATRLTGSGGSVTTMMLEVCAEVCRLCADECERHMSHHEHCRICAEACRRCQSACEAAMAAAPQHMQ